MSWRRHGMTMAALVTQAHMTAGRRYG